MERIRTLSQARGELFTLFEEVTAHAGRKIILRHRGSEHDAVLVSRDYLRVLEQARADAASGSFALFGSATLHGDLEEGLAAIRTEAAAAFDRKMATVGGEEDGGKRRRRTTGRGKRQ